MRVLALDPSITAIGWCSADVEGHDIEVLHVGRVIGSKEGTTIDRTRALVDGIRQVSLNVLAPRQDGFADPYEIVIEIPSGRVALRHTGGGYGLAKYGFAVGAICQMFEVCWGREAFHAVEESIWTGSRSKQARKAIAVKHYAPLKKLKDPGMDMSDAAALAIWWAQVGRHKRKGAD